MAASTSTITMPDPPTRVIQDGAQGGLWPAAASLIISVATSADLIRPWGYPPRDRDNQLAAFWPTEDYFSSALFTMVAQYTSFGFTLKGPKRMTTYSQSMLNQIEFGGGWEALLEPFLVDLWTSDNGAFIEIVRADNNDPSSPCVSLNHLDSRRCVRTGRREEPVIYIDTNGNWHTLKWFNVVAMTEFPSPISEACGIGHCALSRLLRTCQTQRDRAIIGQEKASGRFTRQVHLVSGVQTRVIEDAIRTKKLAAEAEGFTYVQPLILGSLDPTARVSKETIDLASMPADYNEAEALHAYIITLAMAFGTDYENFSPLSGRGSMGSGGGQSKVMNMRSRGKGPRLFMQKMQRLFNFHGILPRSVSFEFGEHDIAEEMEKVELSRSRALEREIRVRSGEITTEVARQIAFDAGDLHERYLVMMQEQNSSDDIVATSVDPIDQTAADGVTPGMPGPDAPPAQSGGAIPRPANSNLEIPRPPSTSHKRIPGGTPVQEGARP
jgi:hypothetical protein